MTSSAHRHRPLLAVLVAALAATTGVPVQGQKPAQSLTRQRASLFELTGAPVVDANANQLSCLLDATGTTCRYYETTNGGLWPRGTINNHVWGGGLTVVGIVQRAASCEDRSAWRRPDCFAWSGDTTGARFWDLSGNYFHSEALTGIFDSGNPDHVQQWPSAGDIKEFPFLDAHANDTTVFAATDLGRVAVSEQDTWAAYWDGNPRMLGGRPHPAGILVEQRTLAWNHPHGNDGTIYNVFRIWNVTGTKLFQQRMEDSLFAGVDALPDAGWRIDSIYVGYDVDLDVGPVATNNYFTGVMPFQTVTAYVGGFYDRDFTYPPAHYHPPFMAAPGFGAIAWLKTPLDPGTGEELGLTQMSQYTSGGSFPSPNTLQRQWRYYSRRVTRESGDPSCSVSVPFACFLSNVQHDVKGFMATGPFSLEPGESRTLVAAVMASAAVATPLITPAPSADNKPGIPSLNPGCGGEPIRAIEVAAGYIGPRAGACPEEGGAARLRPEDIDVVPKSLLHRARVANAMVDQRFRAAQPPEAPAFSLVPGDGRITVVWQPSATEQEGDPFAPIVTDPSHVLYDPNFRTDDLEGYRIYRGTRPDQLELVAQFDRRGTRFADALCLTDPQHLTGSECTSEREVELRGEVIQYDVVGELPNGVRVPFSADTALQVERREGRALALGDTGVPYAYTDTDVRNGFPYWYRVTAFDINSIRSASSSLESEGATKSTRPRAESGAVTSAQVQVGVFGRSFLEPRPSPTLDPVTGTFSGPAAPTDAFDLQFHEFSAQLLPPGSYTIRLDSITPDWYGGIYHFTGPEGTPLEFALQRAPDGDDEHDLPLITIPADSAVRAQQITRGIDAPALAGNVSVVLRNGFMHWHSGDSDWAYTQPAFFSRVMPNTLNGGSRWFAGANETVPDATIGAAAHGRIAGLNSPVFSPDPYRASEGVVGLDGFDPNLMRRFYQSTWALRRAADVRVYWGSARVDSVIDITHDLPVAFDPRIQASYGFIPDGDGNGLISWNDIRYVPVRLASYPSGIPTGFTVAMTGPLAPQPVALPTDVTGDHVAEGTGFGLYINGEMFFFHGPVPSNTDWTLRTYSGAVTGGPGDYGFSTGSSCPSICVVRNPGVPGLRIGVNVIEPGRIAAGAADLSRVHTVPDPYYAHSSYEAGAAPRELQFVNLPPQATIRIYSVSGVLVHILNHDDPTGGGLTRWNLLTRDGRRLASGVYFFHVATPEGREHLGRFTVLMGRTLVPSRF